jgi:hypothetical protein
MTAAGTLERLWPVWAWVRGSRAHAAHPWAAPTFVVLAPLAGAPGISRDEAAVLEAAEPVVAAQAMPAAAAVHPFPSLAAKAAAATHAVLSPLGLAHLRASRIGTALFGALLSAALVLLAWDLSGADAALLAPALYWAAPRHLHAGLVATPDVALAALAVAAVLAYRRAAVDPDRRGRLRAAAWAGLLFGGALAARTDAWILLPVLAAHAAIARALRASAPTAEGIEARLHGIPAALVAMAALGPLVLLALWPSPGSSSLARAALAFAPGAAGAPPGGAPLRGLLPRAVVVTALTVPAPLLLAYLAGVGHAVLRIVRAIRSRAPRSAAVDEALLLLCAAAPFAATSARIAPALGGIRPWLHAMPFLAVLGALALLAAARVAWPGRAAPLAASLALLVLWPSFRASARVYRRAPPRGTSSPAARPARRRWACNGRTAGTRRPRSSMPSTHARPRVPACTGHPPRRRRFAPSRGMAGSGPTSWRPRRRRTPTSPSSRSTARAETRSTGSGARSARLVRRPAPTSTRCRSPSCTRARALGASRLEAGAVIAPSRVSPHGAPGP